MQISSSEANKSQSEDSEEEIDSEDVKKITFEFKLIMVIINIFLFCRCSHWTKERAELKRLLKSVSINLNNH